MNTMKLLEGITSRLNINDIKVSKIVLIWNIIEIEGVITISDVSKDERFDYDYRVTTRDSVETFVNSRLATDVIIQEVRNIENFKSGTTVEKAGKKFMLVPVDESKNSFYLLNLETLEVDDERLTKLDLYKLEYYLEESTIIE